MDIGATETRTVLYSILAQVGKAGGCAGEAGHFRCLWRRQYGSLQTAAPPRPASCAAG